MAVLAAWSGYAAAKWSTVFAPPGHGRRRSGQGANAASLDAVNALNFDATTFNDWFMAYVGETARPWPSPRTGSPRTSTPHLERGWPPAPNQPGRPARADLHASVPPAPKGEGGQAQCASHGRLRAREKARSNADDYVRTTVYLATVLFLAGIGSHFAYRAIRYGLAGVAGALLVVAVVLLVTAPKPA